MPSLLGITYGLDKALPKIFTDRLIEPMKTETHLGQKLKQEADRLKMTPTQVAAYFKVKPPSVYSWYAKGSIHHKHFYNLVQLTGKPLEWWFDFPEQPGDISQLQYSAQASHLAYLFDSLPDDRVLRTEALMSASRVISEIGARTPALQKPAPSVFPQPKKQTL